MGKNSSKFGGLKIELDSYIYSAGEKVSGRVHISINEELPPSELYLIFKGVERTSWSEQHGKHRVHFSGKSIITKVKYMLYAWNTPLIPSSITIPFEFVTPTGIPGSFQYYGSNDLGAIVEYYFRAFIKNDKAMLKDKQSLYLAGTEVYEKIPNEPTIAKIKSWCCIDKGQTTMNIKWINDWYLFGKTIECILEIDNTKSFTKIESITAIVYMGLNVVSGSGHKRYFRHELMRTDYYIPVKKGGVLNGENGGRFSFDLNLTPSPLDLNLVHTSASQLMNSNFFVTFELNTGLCWLCCGDKLEYTSMFFVKPNRQFPTPVFTDLPSGWQPVLYRSVSIEYDIKNEVEENGMSQKLIEWKSSGGNKS